MEKSDKAVKCFLGAFESPRIDPDLQRRGLCRGVIVFAVPELGILFRCRAEGTPVALEFAALFGLLKFIKTKLINEKIESIQVHSSNPEFVFSFAGNSPHLTRDSARLRMLAEYNRQFRIAVGFIEPINNQALISPADYPSLPSSRSINLQPEAEDLTKTSFKPFQRGVIL